MADTICLIRDSKDVKYDYDTSKVSFELTMDEFEKIYVAMNNPGDRVVLNLVINK